MTLFPPEIIEHTTEAHFAKNNKPTQVIYLVVLLALLTALAITPFVLVDITVQSRGIIRSQQENNTVQAAIYGEIEKINIRNNQLLKAGDSLLLAKTDRLNEQAQNIQRNINKREMAFHALPAFFFCRNSVQFIFLYWTRLILR